MEISMSEVWNQIVASLDERIDKHSLETWIQPVKPLELTDEAFTIAVPSKFFATWLEDHHSDIIKQTLKEITGTDLFSHAAILRAP